MADEGVESMSYLVEDDDRETLRAFMSEAHHVKAASIMFKDSSAACFIEIAPHMISGDRIEYTFVYIMILMIASEDSSEEKPNIVRECDALTTLCVV